MKYPGGKGHAYQALINLMPPHRVYIESHLGHGAILRNKRTASRNIGVDIDPTVLRFWKTSDRADIEIYQHDAVAFLRRFRFSGDELLFCDPPYVPETRRRARCYPFDYAVEDHVELLELIKMLPCLVMITGNASELYDKHLATWCRREYSTQTHVGVVKESVWMNYVPGDTLHDYSFIGDTFRDRERIKRKRGTLLRRFSEASYLEQNASLHDLSVKYGARFSDITRVLNHAPSVIRPVSQSGEMHDTSLSFPGQT